MKFTPSSTARLNTALAFSGSSGSPQTPFPVRRIAPNPKRFTLKPSSAKVPVLGLSSDISTRPFRSVAFYSLTQLFPSVATLLPVRGAKAEDAVVLGDRVAAAVTVAREDPEGAIWGLDDIAEPAIFTLQELFTFCYGAVRIESETPETLAAQPR